MSGGAVKDQQYDYIYDVDERQFPASVIEASRQRPVLVDFWADWCAPCIALAPVLERVIGDLSGAVVLAKVEVDDNMRLAGHYRLRGFPTVILFCDGQEKARFTGARPAPWVRQFLESHVSHDVLSA